MALNDGAAKAGDATQWHVVLGGSRGIGFGFAAWLAARNESLIVVGRDAKALEAAQGRLRAAGAPAVRTIAGDVTTAAFRAELLGTIAPESIRSVFIGGPSPPPGYAAELEPSAIAAGYQVCIAYPFEIARGLATRHDRGLPLTIVFLSSSAANEPVHDHPFYLSALLRRSAEHLLKDTVVSRPDSEVIVLRPVVVWTDLARGYATTLTSAAGDTNLRDVLARHFHVTSVPDAETYIARESPRLRPLVARDDQRGDAPHRSRRRSILRGVDEQNEAG